MKKSKEVKQSIIRKITDLLDKWVSDKEIIRKLKLAESTYYLYKSQILKEDKDLLARTRAHELEESTAEVKDSLDYCISINRDICDNSKDDKARIEASAMIVKATYGKLQLKMQPPYNEPIRIISREVNQDTKQLEDKIE